MDEDTRELTVTDFLLERIAEDEAEAESWPSDGQWGRYDETRMWVDPAGHPIYAPRARVLAECAAKRRIVELHKLWPVLVETQPEFVTGLDPDDVARMSMQMSKQILWTTEEKYRERFGYEPPTGPIILALAGVYADHPDFREEWR